MSSEMHLADSKRFKIRPATKEDVSDMTDVFFHSFTNAKFFQYFIPDDEFHRKWWDDAWTMGLENPTDVSFVAVDTESNDRVVAFSRWMKPQDDGNKDRKWPEMTADNWDMELVEKFFGGMGANHEELMQKRSHWFLEMLGVHEDYQKSGIGARLIRWGTEQADAAGIETYLDASAVGRPYYIKRHGFEHAKDIVVPSRPEYGTYNYCSVIRQPQKA